MKTYSKKNNQTRIPLSNVTNQQTLVPTKFYRRDEYDKLRNFKPLNYDESPTKVYCKVNCTKVDLLDAVAVSQSSVSQNEGQSVQHKMNAQMKAKDSDSIGSLSPTNSAKQKTANQFDYIKQRKTVQNISPKSVIQSIGSVDDDSLRLFDAQRTQPKPVKKLSFKQVGSKGIKSMAFEISASDEDDLIAGKGSFANLK